MMVGNKTDLSNDERLVNYQAGLKLSQENGQMLFIETSAKDNYNVDTAFSQLAEKALKRQESLSKMNDNL